MGAIRLRVSHEHFVVVFTCFSILVKSGSRGQERRVLWPIPSLSALEMDPPPAPRALTQGVSLTVGSYTGHHDHHHQKAFSTARRKLNTSTVDRETDDRLS